MTTRTIRETEAVELFEHYPAGYFACLNKTSGDVSFAFGTDSRDELLENESDADFDAAVLETIAS